MTDGQVLIMVVLLAVIAVVGVGGLVEMKHIYAALNHLDHNTTIFVKQATGQ